MVMSIWVVAAILLFVASVINKTVVDSVEKMATPESLVEPVTQIDDAGFLQEMGAFDLWAKQHGFVMIACF